MKKYTENQKAILNALLIIQKEIPSTYFVKKSIGKLLDSSAAPIKNKTAVCSFIIQHFLEKGKFSCYKWIGGNPTIYSAIKIEKEARDKIALDKRNSVKKLANELITIKADNTDKVIIRKDGKTSTEPIKKFWAPSKTPRAKKLKIVEETVLFWGLYRRTRLV